MKHWSGAVAIAMMSAVAAGAGEARAQSADLVLCDRIAADPADPDKPADVRGVADVASADIATAIKFCRAASGSSRRAMYQLGRAYAAGGQQGEALAAYRRAADKGSSSAMVELGVALAEARGVAKDEAQARKLFERAAEAGNARGVTNLAILAKVSGGASDPVRARALLSKGSQTNPEAQYQLGVLLANGEGGPRDDAGARALFEKAAAQNHAGALAQLGAFSLEGRGGLSRDTDAAKTYYQKAAELGSEEAKAALKRAECPYQLRDKRGKQAYNLCF